MEKPVLSSVITVKQELEDTLPNDGKTQFESTNPFLLPKEEVLQEMSFSTDASAKFEPDCHPLKLEPNINMGNELEDTLPNDGKSQFESTNPILLPKEVFQETSFSTDASAKFEPDCHPLKWEPNINMGNVFPVSTFYDNTICKEECATSSMSDLSRICLRKETNLNCQQETPSKIRVLPENDVAKHEDFQSEEISFKCNIREKTFSQRVSLSAHQRSHIGEKPFECDICKKYFTSKSGFYYHQRTHTGEKPFECDICEKRFSQKSNLSVHQTTHTGEKPFKCDVCKKHFTSKAGLCNHRKTHTGEQPFKCDICKKGFTSNSTLSAHKRTHSGEKPFECDICEKRFSNKYHLPAHRRTHTGEKPFKCDICEKTFCHKSSLSVHQTTHTGEKPF